MGHLRTLKVNSSRQIGEDNQNGEFITFTLLISLEMNSGPLKTQSGHKGTNRESPRRGSLILGQIVRKGIPSIQRCWQKPLLYIYFFLHFFSSFTCVSKKSCSSGSNRSMWKQKLWERNTFLSSRRSWDPKGMRQTTVALSVSVFSYQLALMWVSCRKWTTE